MKQWKDYMDAGSEAFSCGHYAEAEECFLRALDAVQKTGTATFKLYQTLNDLVLLYSMQSGKEAEAKLYYDRFKLVKKALKIPDAPDRLQLSKERLEKLISAFSRRKLDECAPMLRELGIDVNSLSQKKSTESNSRVLKPSRILARYRKPPPKEEPLGDSDS